MGTLRGNISNSREVLPCGLDKKCHHDIDGGLMLDVREVLPHEPEGKAKIYLSGISSLQSNIHCTFNEVVENPDKVEDIEISEVVRVQHSLNQLCP